MLNIALTAQLPQLAQDFSGALPFRHVVIDHFFDPLVAQQLLADFPSFEARYARNEMGEVGGKAVRMDMPDISATYAALDQMLQSTAFLQQVSAVTGIPDLLYDADYVGGGTHENVHGQSLDTHVDFNYLPKTGWHRRLNLIVYLNQVWEDAWGGCLDLHSDPWDTEGDQIKTVLPLFNRCVIFETNEHSWHGFLRIESPEDPRHITRKSLAIYLYTKSRPADETAPSHGTIYVPAGLPAHLDPSLPLGDGNLLELRRRFAQLRGQLKFLYQRELKFSATQQQLIGALQEARNSSGLPLQGFILRGGPTIGFWPDGWIAQHLSFAFKPTRKARKLRLDFWVPPQLPSAQRLRIVIDSQTHILTIAPGQRGSLSHTANWAVGQLISVEVSADHVWSPASSGDSADERHLAAALIEAVVES